MLRDPSKKTLVWRETEVLWAGSVELSITSAVGEQGNKIFSLMFGRIDKGTGERVSGFLRLSDLADIRDIVSQVEALIKLGKFS